MIDYIKGDLAECSPAFAVIDCGGVGYGAHISLSTYAQIKDSASVKLLIHEAVREDAYVLYGFAESDEREMFRLLISVSGVGANTARMILSAYPVGEVQRAIMSDDVKMLSGIKGIGTKTAQRLVVDLKDKVGKMDVGEAGEIFTPSNNTARQEALSALEVLGFNKGASQKVLDKIFAATPDVAVEAAIKQAIKLL